MGQSGGWIGCAEPTGIEREESVSGSGPGVGQATLGALAPRVARRMAALDAHDVVARLCQGDHLLWTLEPREIPYRLGWLQVVDELSAAGASDGLAIWAMLETPLGVLNSQAIAAHPRLRRSSPEKAGR